MASPDSDNPSSVFDSKLESILELLEEEESQHFIYLTGAAGTGKTTLIERVKDECLLRKMVVAPTGVAALNIGGSTINSAFRIGFDTFPNIQESKDPRFKKLLKKLELLIIDEISMVRAPMLDAISETLKIHRNSSEPFGGIHVLACGDLSNYPQWSKITRNQQSLKNMTLFIFLAPLVTKRSQLHHFLNLQVLSGKKTMKSFMLY